MDVMEKEAERSAGQFNERLNEQSNGQSQAQQYPQAQSEQINQTAPTKPVGGYQVNFCNFQKIEYMQEKRTPNFVWFLIAPVILVIIAVIGFRLGEREGMLTGILSSLFAFLCFLYGLWRCLKPSDNRYLKEHKWIVAGRNMYLGMIIDVERVHPIMDRISALNRESGFDFFRYVVRYIDSSGVMKEIRTLNVEDPDFYAVGKHVVVFERDGKAVVDGIAVYGGSEEPDPSYSIYREMLGDLKKLF